MSVTFEEEHAGGQSRTDSTPQSVAAESQPEPVYYKHGGGA